MALRGACEGKPEAWWFPTKGLGGRGGDRVQYANARTVCAACPIRQECLELAMRAEEGPRATRTGMFGGLTPRERAALSDDRAAAGCQ